MSSIAQWVEGGKSKSGSRGTDAVFLCGAARVKSVYRFRGTRGKSGKVAGRSSGAARLARRPRG